MLYVKKVIAMLRSVLHDISIKISCNSGSSIPPEALDLFSRIFSSLASLEKDFSEFLKIYKEVSGHDADSQN